MKKTFISLVFAAMFVACSQPAVNPPGAKIEQVKADPAEILRGREACFLLYDIKAAKLVRAVGGDELCSRRLTPCSTFKVPVALMGFDSGVIKDENTSYKWDGTKREVDSWNQDQTAESWIKYSAAWVTQRITPKIGMERIKQYLHSFKYGNEDMSAGILTAWLNSTPNSKAIRISANEQLEFMKEFWAERLPLSKHAFSTTKKIMFHERTDKGETLHGKTGSGFTTQDRTGRIGWFIAHVDGPKGEYISILNFTDKVPKGAKGYAGLQAREMTKLFLANEGLWTNREQTK